MHPAKTRKDNTIVGGRITNPWIWQAEFVNARANEVSCAQRTLYCSGHNPNDAPGAAVHPGDIGRLAEAGCRHTRSLIGVARLAFREIMIKIEATAPV